jgi:hypothetical protein
MPIGLSPDCQDLLPMPKVSDTIAAPIGVLGEPVRRGIKAIDDVHDADSLPMRRVRRMALPRGEQGRYDPTPPYELVVATGAQWPVFTTVHEIAHLLDHQGFGGGARFASRLDPRFADWRTAVAASQSLLDLADLRIAATAANLPDLVTHLSYLTEYVGLWARSYQQYIALRSGDPVLRQALDSSRTREPNKVYIPYYWDDADFASIAAAIDEVLRSRGWRP